MAASMAFYLLAGCCGAIFILRQYFVLKWGKCRSENRLDGKTVIITGANSGLGKITALELVRRGAKVILACRNMESGEKAALEICNRLGVNIKKDQRLIVRHLDLSSFASIRQFSNDIIANERRVDILINNAGVGWCPYSLTNDQIETQFGVNHLGHFLLTNLLMNVIVNSSPSRVITVASSLYRKASPISFDKDHLNNIVRPDPTNYDPSKAYFNSKLANILFARHLACRVHNKGVTSVSLCPGMVLTNLGRHRKLTLWQKLALSILSVAIVRTPLQGCQTIIHCALDDRVSYDSKSSGFYRNCKSAELEPIALDDDVASQLWDLSTKLTKLAHNHENN